MKRLTKTIVTMVVFTFLTLFLASCDESFDQLALNEAIDAIELVFAENDDINAVTEDLTLPDAFGKVTITWQSGNTSVITDEGVVTRQRNNTSVTLVAVATYNGLTATKSFTVTVLAADETPILDILEDARAALLIPGVGNGVTQNVVLPTTVGQQGVTVTWESSDPTILADDGTLVFQPETNTNLTMTATLHLEGQTLTKEFNLVVIAAADVTHVQSIQEAKDVSTDEEGVVTRTYVMIPAVTILGITNDGVVFHDGTDLLFAYMGARRNDLVVGDVYNVRGLTDRYFGSWQLNNTADPARPVVFMTSDEPAETLEPTVVGSVTEMLSYHGLVTDANPNLVYTYYRLTAKVRIQGTGNYDTVFVDPDYEGGDIPTTPNSPHAEDGVMIYYQSNKAAFDAFDGVVITFDALFYSYRSDRTVFTILYLGTVNDIQLSLPDEELLDLVQGTLESSFDDAYTLPTTLDLPTSLLGASVAWSTTSPYVDLETGALTMPENAQESVTLTANLSINETVRSVDITFMIGELDISTLAEARAASGKVRVQGVITAQIDNRTFMIQDATGALAIYTANADMISALKAAIGKQVDLVADRGAYNGLEQLAPVSLTVLGDGVMPVARSITNVPFNATDLLPFQAMLVSAEGLEVSSVTIDQYNNIILKLKNANEEEIELRYDSRVTGVDVSSIDSLVVGDFVNLIAVPLSWASNAPRLYYTNPSQVTIADYIPETDEEKVLLAADALDIPEQIGADTTLALPTDGLYGTSIAWESDNAQIDAATGAVTVTGTTVTVTLTATVSLNDAEEIRTYEIAVGFIAQTVAFARAAEVGTQVTIEVTITAVSFDSSDRAVVFAQDAYDGIYLYKIPAAYKAHLAVGNTIRVTGARAVYQNLVQLNNFVDVQLVSEGNETTPLVVTDWSMLPDVQGQLVSVTGYLKQTYTGTPSDYHLVTTEGQVALRLVSGSDALGAQRDAVIAKLVGVPAGTEVTVVAGVGQFSSTMQVMLFNDSQITIGEAGTAEDLAFVALANLEITQQLPIIELSVTLPTEGLFGFTFAWSSDNEAVFSNEGIVTRPAPGQPDALVNIDFSVMLGEVEILSGTIEVTVPAGAFPVSTLADARAAASGTQVRIQGVLTAQLDHRTFTVQDGTGALAIYTSNTDMIAALSAALGQNIDLIATRGAYNGLEQLAPVTLEVLGAGTMPEGASLDAVAFTPETLLPFQSMLVSVTGLEVVSSTIDGFGNIIVIVKNASGEELEIRYDSRYEGVDTSSINALVAGDFINIVSAPLGWSNGPRVYYSDPSYVTIYEVVLGSVGLAREAAVDTIVTIEAVVTAVSLDSTGRAVAFVQDATHGIYLYKVPADLAASVVVGNLIEVTGTRAVFGDLVQISTITSVTVLEEGVAFSPLAVNDPLDLPAAEGRLISVTGYLRQTYTGTPSDYHLVTEAGTFALRLVSGSDALAADRDAVIAALVGVQAGTEITVTAGLGRYYATYQIMLFDASMISVGALGASEDLSPIVLANLVLPEENDAVTSSISLPATGMFGATITWTSDNEDVIANDGSVTRPTDADQTVVLSYVVQLGEDIIAEGDLTFVVLAELEPVEPELDLFFSEYIEGGSNNKALEIYNPTSDAVDLTPYVVELYSNGRLESAGATNSLDLTGTLEPGAVIIIVNAGATEDFKLEGSIESTVTYFNGDDAVVLRNDGVIIDSIGQLGVDPGSEWAANGVSTVNMTLVRKASVQYGRRDATSAFDPSLEWDAHPQDTATFLGSHTMDPIVSGPVITELFFSEYIEGGSFNKAIEIYNGTGADVDLSTYSVALFSNGSATASQTVALEGTLADGEVIIIVNGQATEAFKVGNYIVSSTVANFNGDDALVLYNGTDVVDSFGQVGFDPGSAWTSGDVSTVNKTLVRMPSVTSGDTTIDDAFDPSLEWIAYPQDTADYLGSHTVDA